MEDEFNWTTDGVNAVEILTLDRHKETPGQMNTVLIVTEHDVSQSCAISCWVHICGDMGSIKRYHHQFSYTRECNRSHIDADTSAERDT